MTDRPSERYLAGHGVPGERIQIPKQSGHACVLGTGDLLRVIDPEGGQVADVVAFSHPDRALRFSTDQTRDIARTIYLTTGHALFALSGEPLLTIVADDVGRHDYLYAWCRPEFYRRLWQETDHPNCHDNLLGALERFGVTSSEMPMPFNVFQNVTIHPDGGMEVFEPLSRPGDSIVLRAEREVVVAVSACSVVKSRCNSFHPGPIALEVYRGDTIT